MPYIDVFKLMQYANNMADKTIDANDIARFPWADVQEVNHGRWMLVKGSDGKDYHKCSECLHTQEITGVKTYCAVCGARMESRDDPSHPFADSVMMGERSENG